MENFLGHLSKLNFAPAACLDVGANRGEWSRQARATFPNAALFLIEPQEEMAATLTAYCERVGAAKWMLAGAGSELGATKLAVWPGLAGSTFYDAPEINEEW